MMRLLKGGAKGFLLQRAGMMRLLRGSKGSLLLRVGM